jgi:DNA-binding winged helix-turn-helix (wHTH) protein
VTAATSYRFGSFLLDVFQRQLSRDDDVITLTPKAFDMLVLLVEHRHRVMSKEELMTAVWRRVRVGGQSQSVDLRSAPCARR